jgi:GT2 family glycosyltransferase/tetratricopeptide (TPR) repeat protein
MIESAARVARERLDQVLVGDVETLTDRFQPASFDIIVCGDVLEHLREPAALLRRARTWLKSDGRLVTSIPNVRHHSAVRGLLEGNWTYESAGLLDRDHLRFFTRREIEKLFFRAGFEVKEIQGVLGPGDQEPADQARTGRFNIGSLHLSGMRAEQIQEFFIYQYLLTARPEPAPDWGLTSIIILTHNELPYTRMCLDSIRLSTDEPYELIVVDNASTDGTVEYLQTLPEIKLIQNAQNLGFPKAVNQGIQKSTGRQILLLNNDCIVPTAWLHRMVRALHNDPKIALVGPCSNLVSGEQEVKVYYDDLSGLDGFAWDFGRTHDRNLEDTDRLVGFCLLIRRELIDKIGLLDERFGLGCFEDDDYCRRALLAGFRVVIARDAFVHHFGGQTFRASGVDFAALMEKNRRLFDAKWSGGPIPQVSNRQLQPPNGPDSLNAVTTGQANRAPPNPTEKKQETKNGLNALRTNSCQRSTVASLPSRACSSSLSPKWSPSSAYALRLGKGGGLLLVRQEIELSLCMIVRDNSRTIAAALKSIKPWVDEMIVVDTGSKDNTPKIAADLGARVFQFSWRDDFSAARNESLQHARGRWLFWMDSDDTIDAPNGRTLRELIRRADPSTLGFVVSVNCPGAGQEGQFDVTAVTHVKLFRNRPDLRFDGRIHEQILGAINLAGGEVAWSDVFVVHSGYDHTPEGQKRKLERDLRILHLELKERPDHPFTLFNLGMTYTDMKDYRKGADFLQRSLDTSRETDSHLRKVYALLVYCYDQLELPNVAEETCRKGLEKFPLDAELRFRQANLDHQAGRLTEAARRLQDLLKTKEEPHFLSYDRGIDGFKARQNLAVVYTDMGDLKKAEGEWRRVVGEVPHYRPGWRGLAENLLQQCKNDEAEELAKRLLQNKSLAMEGLILKSQLALRRGNLQSAMSDLRRAVRDYPNHDRPLEALSQFLFEHGDLRDAEKPLKQLVRVDPENPSAHHNLGTVYLRKGEFEAAVTAFRESLKHRANSAPTWFHLGNALKASGQLQEAVDAWQQAHRLDPDNVEIQDALRESKAR